LELSRRGQDLAVAALVGWKPHRPLRPHNPFLMWRRGEQSVGDVDFSDEEDAPEALRYMSAEELPPAPTTTLAGNGVLRDGPAFAGELLVRIARHPRVQSTTIKRDPDSDRPWCVSVTPPLFEGDDECWAASLNFAAGIVLLYLEGKLR